MASIADPSDLTPPRALLAALTAERYDGTWWTAKRRSEERLAIDDSDVTIARRRRQVAEEYDRLNASEREVG